LTSCLGSFSAVEWSSRDVVLGGWSTVASQSELATRNHVSLPLRIPLLRRPSTRCAKRAFQAIALMRFPCILARIVLRRAPFFGRCARRWINSQIDCWFELRGHMGYWAATIGGVLREPHCPTIFQLGVMLKLPSAPQRSFLGRVRPHRIAHTAFAYLVDPITLLSE
jgi:hypothetical protein